MARSEGTESVAPQGRWRWWCGWRRTRALDLTASAVANPKRTVSRSTRFLAAAWFRRGVDGTVECDASVVVLAGGEVVVFLMESARMTTLTMT